MGQRDKLLARLRRQLDSAQQTLAELTELQDADSRVSPAAWPYKELADELREEIASGVITDRLPSEKELVRTRSLARETVRHALDLLRAEGVIESRPGRGWFVVERAGS